MKTMNKQSYDTPKIELIVLEELDVLTDSEEDNWSIWV